MSESKKIWYRLRGALIVPFYLFALFYNQGEINNPWIVHPAGTIFFMLGLGLRIWAQMHLHYRLKTHKMLTLTGPYLYVRNPIYIGNTLVLVGITVLSGLLWFVPVMVIACGFTYHMTVLYEEGHLSKKYGQGYVEFFKRIPRWLPRLQTDQEPEAVSARSYFLPSVVAELHILLLLVPLFLIP